VRGVRRSLSRALTPKLKIALLRHLAGKLAVKGAVCFTDVEYEGFMDGMVADQLPARVLKTLEEQTSLLVQNEEGQWRFRDEAIQSYLYALYVTDKADARAVPGDGEDSSLLRRAWRYVCWIASDASQLLTVKETGPYSYDGILLSARALSQNLLVHNDAVRGYALGVQWLLDSLMRDAVVSVESESSEASPRASSRMVCRVVSKTRPIDDLRKIGELLQALHRGRDGVAGTEVRGRLGTSSFTPVRSMLSIVECEGILEYTVAQRLDDLVLTITVEQ
jgi:hypothetical protein